MAPVATSFSLINNSIHKFVLNYFNYDFYLIQSIEFYGISYNKTIKLLFDPILIEINYKPWVLEYFTTHLRVFTNMHIIVIIDIIYSYLFYIYFSVFTFNFFIKTVRKVNNTTFFLHKILKEHDQETASFEDLIIFIVFFSAFFINTFDIASSSDMLWVGVNATFFLLFICFFFLVIVTPVSVLGTIGQNCFIYIKGTDKFNALMSYLVFDAIATLAFFLRFFLQIIRWGLFITTYYLLHEFVFEWSYNLVLSIFYPSYLFQSVIYYINNNAILTILIQFLRFIFEVFDTCLILVIQITAFIAVILWLFNYLFSLSIDDMYESLFENKLN